MPDAQFLLCTNRNSAGWGKNSCIQPPFNRDPSRVHIYVCIDFHPTPIASNIFESSTRNVDGHCGGTRKLRKMCFVVINVYCARTTTFFL